MFLSVRIAGAAALGALMAPTLTAQRSTTMPPATYAITGARLVTVSGPTIERGTIVIRNGLIAAVGASITAPADARIIDGTGLTVYPGLIDAGTTLGIPATPTGAQAATAAPRPALAPNSSYAAGLQPEVSVLAALAPERSMFTAAHAAGFTTALTAVGTGVFRGQSAVINLIDTDVADMVVAAPVAQHLGFSRGGGGFGGGGGFPGSLMGVFAQLRQELFDAQRYRDLSAAYRQNPRGKARPEWNPSLEALLPVLAGDQPVVMFANTEREIERALDLAREFKLKAIIAGGSEAYKVAARLKADKVPVFLSVNFPRRAAAGGGGQGGRGQGGGGAAADTPESMRTLRDRVAQPGGPATLAAAGVSYSLTSGNNYPEFLANLRRAVTAGLTSEQAVRALTVEPARLLGVSDRLGTLEVGKIANLTVVTGDLLVEGSRVSQLFVDGAPIEMPAPPAPAAQTRTP
jgi:imidazolonepropionase-like amidohydrolase